jgi:hypothetical protein
MLPQQMMASDGGLIIGRQRLTIIRAGDRSNFRRRRRRGAGGVCRTALARSRELCRPRLPRAQSARAVCDELAHRADRGQLAAVHHGRIRRLLVNLPPRHLKSHLASIAFPAWPGASGSGRARRSSASPSGLRADCRSRAQPEGQISPISCRATAGGLSPVTGTRRSSARASRRSVRRCPNSRRRRRASASPPRSAAC